MAGQPKRPNDRPPHPARHALLWATERNLSLSGDSLPALMHATQVTQPFHTKGWVYEEKYDGWRMLAVKEAGGVRPISRNGRDHTKRFHTIADALAALKPKTLTLDGEVAVFDRELVSRFEWLRHINHGDLATPPLFMVFDLLQLEEAPGLPWLTRPS